MCDGITSTFRVRLVTFPCNNHHAGGRQGRNPGAQVQLARRGWHGHIQRAGCPHLPLLHPQAARHHAVRVTQSDFAFAGNISSIFNGTRMSSRAVRRLLAEKSLSTQTGLGDTVESSDEEVAAPVAPKKKLNAFQVCLKNMMIKKKEE